MKKSALLMALAFFATAVFGPANTLAKKKEKTTVPAKTEQVKAVKTETPKPAEKPAVKTEAKPAEKPAVKAEAKPAEKPAVKAEAKPAEKPAVKADAKPEVKPTTSTAGPTKSDGTPDMRYKQNKQAPKAAGPLKKDGTPDMRYKANKENK
jgi:hypothetical protein